MLVAKFGFSSVQYNGGIRCAEFFDVVATCSFSLFRNRSRQSNIVDDNFCRGKRLQLGDGVESRIKLIGNNEATKEVQEGRCHLIGEIPEGQVARETRDLNIGKQIVQVIILSLGRVESLHALIVSVCQSVTTGRLSFKFFSHKN